MLKWSIDKLQLWLKEANFYWHKESVLPEYAKVQCKSCLKDTRYYFAIARYCFCRKCIWNATKRVRWNPTMPINAQQGHS